MALTAKVENYYSQNVPRPKTICIEESERACINCIWYEPYFRENRGNIAGRAWTSLGWCIRRGERRGALKHTCKDFSRNIENKKHKIEERE